MPIRLLTRCRDFPPGSAHDDPGGAVHGRLAELEVPKALAQQRITAGQPSAG